MKRIHIIITLLTFITIAFSCRKDDIITDSSAKLNFSTDTVIFDTTFATIGSATRRMLIYNNNNEAINISSIGLSNGANSQFRINVDGVSGNSHSNVEIDANDSLYVFIEVTIDPTNGFLPFVVKDNIVFSTNGNSQLVALAAWGQDAHYYVANKNVGSIPVVYLDRDNSNGAINATWINDKPYVIYGGYLALDANDKLNIEKGVRVHLHNNSGIWVSQGGNLNVNGTADSVVSFQGTRLEYSYQDIPGQWDRIWINEGSVDNVFNYAVIRNSFIGIQAESDPFTPSAVTSTNHLILNNSIIHNAQIAGVLAKNYRIKSENTLISNCGQYNLLVTGGGEYIFKHATLANYWSGTDRQTPVIHLQNYYSDINGNTQVRDLDSTSFYNTIIDGSLDVEFTTNALAQGNFNYLFDHCLIKTTASTSGANYQTIWKNQSNIFVDQSSYDFHLSSGSVANNNGVNRGVINDLDGNIRNASTPDIGAFEH